MTCDVCRLPDPYNGQGDGIGSCDCPRCDCGEAVGSVLCGCPDDDYWSDVTGTWVTSAPDVSTWEGA